MKTNKLKQYDFKRSDQVDFPFEILSLEKLPSVALSKNAHRHSFYEIFYVSGGKGTHFIDFQPHNIIPPLCYFISPGQIHYWEQVVQLSGYVILFTEDFLILEPSKSGGLQQLPYFHSLEETSYLKIGKDQDRIITGLIKNLKAEYNSNSFGSVSILHSYFNILLVYIQRFYEAANPSIIPKNNSEFVRRFKQLVADHCAEQWSIKQYADRIAVSPSHLRDIVKKTTGQPPRQIINQTLALEAKRLLLHTNLTVSEIGFALSFEDPSYFARFIKKETGMSPTDYRQKNSLSV